MRRSSLPPNARFFAVSARASSPSSASTTSSSPSASAPPPTIALRAALAYDGSGFAGFQLQNGTSGTKSGSKRKKGSVDNGAARTVQGELEKALLVVSSGGRGTKEESEGARRAALRLHAAGRTDAGVHARGQAISFALPARTEGGEEEFDEERLAALERSLNRLLPIDVRLRNLERCPPDFSARFSALGKHYSFSVFIGSEPDPLTRRYSHFERRRRPREGLRPGSGFSLSPSPLTSSVSSLSLSSLPLLDVDAMREAASHFIGQRDFTHFASINAGNPASDPVRLVERASVSVLGGDETDFDAGAREDFDDDGDGDASSSSSSSSSTAAPPPRSLRLRFDFQGDGFLFRQVRHMSGALIAVGLGKLHPRDIKEKLEKGSRDPPRYEFRGWKVADAAGLCLERVFYPSYENYLVPIHADLPHDEFGRVSLEALSQRNRRREREESFSSSSSSSCSSSSSSSSPLIDEELRSVKAARRRAAGMPATGGDLLEREEKEKKESP